MSSARNSGTTGVASSLPLADAPPTAAAARPCTCHPNDYPPTPCPQKYALLECRAAAEDAALALAMERVDRWLDREHHSFPSNPVSASVATIYYALEQRLRIERASADAPSGVAAPPSSPPRG